VNVIFDGFTFDGTTAGNGIGCTGDNNAYADTKLTVLRSTIANGASGVVGVASTGQCTLTMDQDVVSSNKGGGISLATTNFNITNTLINGNGTGGPGGSGFGGIFVNSAGQVGGPMNLINLTVVDNQKNTTTASSGIHCSVPATITNTVVFGNMGGTLQLQPLDCSTPTSSSFPSAAATMGNIDNSTCVMTTDLFTGTSPTPYMPLKNPSNPKCKLVDVGTNAGAPDHDLLGTKRPQPSPSGTVDIGCYEVPQP
jgi:hypothetical protein